MPSIRTTAVAVFFVVVVAGDGMLLRPPLHGGEEGATSSHTTIAAAAEVVSAAAVSSGNTWPSECLLPASKKPTVSTQSECASATGSQPFDDVSLGLLTKIKCYYVLTSIKRNVTAASSSGGPTSTVPKSEALNEGGGGGESGGGGGTEATFNFSMLRAIELTYQGQQESGSSPSPPAATVVTHGTGLTTFKTTELSLNQTDYLAKVVAYTGRTLFAINFTTESGKSISCGDMGSLVPGTDYNVRTTTATPGNFFGSLSGVQIQRSSDTDKSYCGVTSVPSLILYEFPDGGSSNDGGGGLSVGTTVGVTIAGISVILTIIGIIVFFLFRRKRRSTEKSSSSSLSPHHLADPQHLHLHHAAEATIIADPLLLPFPSSTSTTPMVSATAAEEGVVPSATLHPPVIATHVEMPLYDGRFIVFPAARAADVGGGGHQYVICPHHQHNHHHALPFRGASPQQHDDQSRRREDGDDDYDDYDDRLDEEDTNCWFCMQQRDDNQRRRRLFATKCANNVGIAAGIVEDEFRSELEDSDYRRERQI